MAGATQAGPTCGHNNPVVVDDGTLCRAQSPAPGPVSSGIGASFASFAGSIESEFQAAKATVKSTYGSVERGLRSDYEGGRCLYRAYKRAEDLAPDAILQETGYQLGSLLQGLLPGLLQMIVIMAATTLLGAAVGGIVGLFCGGAGAAPGAVVGGELGFDAGMAVLTWLGVAFLAGAMIHGFGEMMVALRNGIEWAWQARNLEGGAQQMQVDRAAHELARTTGILMRLILQGILAYLLKKAAENATRGAMTTASMARAGGAGAVSDATVAELAGKLRASRFGDGFADWLEKNWPDLRDNEKLKSNEAPRADGGGAGSDAAGGKLADLQDQGAARRTQSYDDIADYKKKYEAKEQEARDDGENRRAGGFKAKVTEAIGEDAATKYMQQQYPDFVMDQGFSPGTGFDQVYTKYDAAGNPVETMIVEAKGPGAKLSTEAAKGPQMSQEWVENSVSDMTNSSDPATRALGQRLQKALDTGVPPLTGKVIQAAGAGAKEIALPNNPVYNGGRYN